MVAVLLALASSVTIGVADFFAGVLSRRMPVALVLLAVEGVGLIPVLIVVLVTGDPFPGMHQAITAVIAGLAGCVGLACFYRALVVGTMSIVAPVSATGVILAVIVGVATGDRPGTTQVIGLLLAFTGVVAASREGSDDANVRRASRAALGLALLSAVGFGIYFIAADVAADGGVPWALALSRGASVPVILLVARASGVLAPPDRRTLLALVGVGLLDVTATALFGLANTEGLVSVVSVISALYPITTIVLAAALLSERVSRSQGAGIVAAMAGVALIAAG